MIPVPQPRPSRVSAREETDTPHWYGLKFPDLDCPHWLPYLTAEELGRDSPKLALPITTCFRCDQPFFADEAYVDHVLHSGCGQTATSAREVA